ncbi:MAG TPA: acyl-CoA dehydrogenase family protein, partial [Terracidiphilus sp.]
MTDIITQDKFAEIREGVRTVCNQFGNPYFQKVTREHLYPEEFVTALTKARWLSALIPKEYGGLG